MSIEKLSASRIKRPKKRRKQKIIDYFSLYVDLFRNINDGWIARFERRLDFSFILGAINRVHISREIIEASGGPVS